MQSPEAIEQLLAQGESYKKKKKKASKSREQLLEQKQQDQKEELIYYVALRYPQYTLKQLYEEIPLKQVVKLAQIARKEEAQSLLTLNNIINGPNVKGKSKKEYKDTIHRLQDQLTMGKKKNINKLR